MTTLPLSASVSATIASGRAIGRLSPQVAGSSWRIKRMVTTANIDSTTLLNLKVYKNSEQAGNLLDGTDSAAQDASETDITLETTDVLIAVWSSDDPALNGSICTLIVSGDNYTGR